MQPIIDGFLEPRFRAKNKRRKFWNPTDAVICFEYKIKNKEPEQNE